MKASSAAGEECKQGCWFQFQLEDASVRVQSEGVEGILKVKVILCTVHRFATHCTRNLFFPSIFSSAGNKPQTLVVWLAEKYTWLAEKYTLVGREIHLVVR